MKKIAVIHGPNLNLLSTREPEIYGTETLEQINTQINEKAKAKGWETSIFQSNSEGEIVDFIQKIESEGIKDLIINPGAFTHTSVAVLDALKAVKLNIIEVHLSNIHALEDFRKTSITGAAAKGIISGFGAKSYLLALDAID